MRGLRSTQLHTAAIGLIGFILPLTVHVQIANGQDGESARTIRVTGDAEVRVVPDEVVLVLGVETSDLELARAKNENDTRMGMVIQAAERLGVERKLIRTDYLGIEPRYRYPDREQREFLGYWVQKTVIITLRDIDTFETLLSDVLAAGANYVHGIQFQTTELRTHREQARAMALKAARDKAELMAAELDEEIGLPSSIQETNYGWWSGYGAWWGGRWGNARAQNVSQAAFATTGAPPEGVTEPGQISVTAQVAVTFELK